ncbi:hypothetical protein OPT61_g7702 [Boeremia exigua]|uniref:Uncharacterized protein n=1 Tax=Boeremia exigua TaxID=749465 RepID=A0ACC2I175_9PLEO|nr:hypothetical protein OPT61_g7702 [Boeremia exigua]
MMMKVVSGAVVASTLAQIALAKPQSSGPKLQARQSINFDLVDNSPDPVVQPGDTSHFNPAAAIASVVAEVKSGAPLAERKRALEARDIVVTTYPGYTTNTALGNVAINAPLDCNQKDTYMGVRLFTGSAFDTALCAAACSAQSEYNVAHPPPDGPAQTCQFYNTYALYKNDVYEGQYCTFYNQTWAPSFATNDGQWRGTDHYTIQSSYIASNATKPGICPSATNSVPDDPTTLLTSPEDIAFCAAYINYAPPVQIIYATTTISTVTRTTNTRLETSTPPAQQPKR